MPVDRAHTDRLLADLELAIKGRRRWRGKRVFYQTLGYDLEPILQTAVNPEYVHQRVREMLVKHGHDPDPPPPLPPASHPFNDGAHIAGSVDRS